MGRENREICRVTHAYFQQIHYKLPFTLSNKVELFERMRSLGYVMPHPRVTLYRSLLFTIQLHIIRGERARA